MPLILQEALRGLFYAPFYVALSRDAFAGEGVEIRFTSSPHPNETALRVMDGTVDVSWGGPMRVMETYHKLADCDLVVEAVSVPGEVVEVPPAGQREGQTRACHDRGDHVGSIPPRGRRVLGFRPCPNPSIRARCRPFRWTTRWCVSPSGASRPARPRAITVTSIPTWWCR